MNHINIDWLLQDLMKRHDISDIDVRETDSTYVLRYVDQEVEVSSSSDGGYDFKRVGGLDIDGHLHSHDWHYLYRDDAVLRIADLLRGGIACGVCAPL